MNDRTPILVMTRDTVILPGLSLRALRPPTFTVEAAAVLRWWLDQVSKGRRNAWVKGFTD
jgi:hypothetical protein